MKTPKIRSNVYIGKNIEGTVYTAGEQTIQVKLNQTVIWFDNNQLIVEEREVPHNTEISLYKKWFTLPGNIVKSYTLEPLPECYETTDTRGNPIETLSGYQVYHFYYYSPRSKYQPYGELEEEEILNDFISSVNT